MGAANEIVFRASNSGGSVRALLVRPPRARALVVVGHGAGAGMRHPFLETVAAGLAERELATFRYQFPYMEQGRKRPDHAGILKKTVRSAVRTAADAAPDLPLFAGGKSMGGRMTSLAHADAPLPGVSGLVFWGFPLHAPAKPGAERGAHLADVGIPMLFLQGTRDRLARLDLLEPVLAGLDGRATLHVVDDADHSFHVPKRSGRTDEEVLAELADRVAAFCGRH